MKLILGSYLRYCRDTGSGIIVKIICIILFGPFYLLLARSKEEVVAGEAAVSQLKY